MPEDQEQRDLYKERKKEEAEDKVDEIEDRLRMDRTRMMPPDEVDFNEESSCVVSLVCETVCMMG